MASRPPRTVASRSRATSTRITSSATGARLGNGTGQRDENNRYKRAYLAVPLQWKDLHVEPYADYESGINGRDAALYKVFAGYEFKRAGVGAEWADYVVHTRRRPCSPSRPATRSSRAAVSPRL